MKIMSNSVCRKVCATRWIDSIPEVHSVILATLASTFQQHCVGVPICCDSCNSEIHHRLVLTFGRFSFRKILLRQLCEFICEQFGGDVDVCISNNKDGATIILQHADMFVVLVMSIECTMFGLPNLFINIYCQWLSDMIDHIP
jgi:hypothetical protein